MLVVLHHTPLVSGRCRLINGCSLVCSMVSIAFLWDILLLDSLRVSSLFLCGPIILVLFLFLFYFFNLRDRSLLLISLSYVFLFFHTSLVSWFDSLLYLFLSMYLI